MRRRGWIVGAIAVLLGSVPVSVAAAAPGDLDPGFGSGGRVRTVLRDASVALAIARQSNGKLIAVGTSAVEEPGLPFDHRFEILRYLPDGSLDQSFGNGGVLSIVFPGNHSAIAEDVVIRPDDKIVVAGRATAGFAIAQLTPDGQFDNGFGTGGLVVLPVGTEGGEAAALALEPDGQIVVAGRAWTEHRGGGIDIPSFAAVRLEPNGALDTSFGDGGEVLIEMTETDPSPFSVPESGVADLVRYSDGRIALVGSGSDDWSDDGDGQYRPRLAIARLTSAGQLDPSFSGNGKLITPVRGLKDHATGHALALTPDGRLTVAARYYEYQESASYAGPKTLIVRFKPNGELDPEFESSGSTLLDFGGSGEAGVEAMRYQTDGKLVVAGIVDPVGFDPARFGVARLDGQGTPDPDFGTGGIVSGPPFAPGDPWGRALAYDLLLEPSGDIAVAGAADGQFVVVRYQGDSPPPPPPPPLPTYVALGDSYSSGFGAGDYESGTHKDDTTYPDNDCQRSANAFGPIVADTLDMPLVFKACQGAVTRDLMFPSTHSWAEGESAQVDHLGPDVELVTFSIGGNDVDFADHLAECILGFELLPFNTCSGDDKVTKPVQEALELLDGRRANPSQMVPYDEIFKSVRERAPFATRVAVGYPEFFLEEGGDRTSLPGGRCEAVKQADQRWIVEQIRNLNRIIRRNALGNGFLFVDPSPYFDGNELCSGGKEWFFPLLTPGQFHPTPEGQHAIADAVLDALAADANPPGSISFTVSSGESVSHAVSVPDGSARLTVSTEWPGSDVLTSLTSPSGETYTRSNPGPAAYHDNGATWEQFEITNPEPGEWLIELYGADVSPDGEPVSLSARAESAPNAPPTATISHVRNGNDLLFDASQSSDTDGKIDAYEWYVTSPTVESTATGPSLTLPAESTEGRTVTLIVIDDQGSTAFAAATVPASSMEPQGNPGSAAPIVDLLAPSLYDIRLQTRMCRGWKRSQVVHGRARLLARLSEDAQVTFQVVSKLRRGKRQVLNLLAGEQQISLARLLRHVAPGGYQLSLAAQDSAGNIRKYRVGFRVVRRARCSPQAK